MVIHPQVTLGNWGLSVGHCLYGAHPFSFCLLIVIAKTIILSIQCLCNLQLDTPQGHSMFHLQYSNFVNSQLWRKLSLAKTLWTLHCLCFDNLPWQSSSSQNFHLWKPKFYLRCHIAVWFEEFDFMQIEFYKWNCTHKFPPNFLRAMVKIDIGE